MAWNSSQYEWEIVPLGFRTIPSRAGTWIHCIIASIRKYKDLIFFFMLQTEFYFFFGGLAIVVHSTNHTLRYKSSSQTDSPCTVYSCYPYPSKLKISFRCYTSQNQTSSKRISLMSFSLILDAVSSHTQDQIYLKRH